MIAENITIINKLGLHARAASKLVNCASQFESEVFIVRNENRVNAKSIMGVMMLAAEQGSQITLRADGEDEREAIEALEKLIKDKFYEDNGAEGDGGQQTSGSAT